MVLVSLLKTTLDKRLGERDTSIVSRVAKYWAGMMKMEKAMESRAKPLAARVWFDLRQYADFGSGESTEIESILQQRRDQQQRWRARKVLLPSPSGL